LVRDVQPHWVGNGFPVRSLFSYSEGNDFDPFLLLDYGGPFDFSPSESTRGVEEHPHRGFETVTIVYQGELAHRDSSGSQGSIGPGDVQWMTAASGIVHEEFHSEEFSITGGTLEMVQLWVNLPAKDKMSAPHYQGILDSAIPRVTLANDAGIARVIAGDFLGTHGAAKTFTPINAWDLRIKTNKSIDLQIPAGHTSLLIVQTGSAKVIDSQVNSGELVLFERQDEIDTVTVTADSESRILVLTGEPLNEPVVGRGPFVMNTQTEIHQAIRDYQAGRMGQLT
jgi:redox-sensitive bicupin YhaK (pirin superfamily)